MTQHDTAISEVLPLGPLQEGLLFHHTLTGAAADVYAVQCRITLRGAVHAERLRAAAAALLRRHPNLRAGFAHEGFDQPVQFVPADTDVAWSDIAPDGSADGPASVDRVAEHELARGFDLTAPPLIRFAHVRGEEADVLVVTAHHILLDGWSLPLLVDELCALYRTGGDATALPPAPAYRDHLAWLARLDRESAEAAWRAALADLPGPCLVAPDHPGGTRLPRRLTRPLGAQFSRRLRLAAREHRVTLNTLLQAAWASALATRTGTDDVVFGQPVSGRAPEVPDSHAMIGLFTNTLPVRVRLRPEEPVGALLRRLHAEQADLVDHHALGLSAVQRAAGATGPLFDTLLVVESFPLDRSGHAADHAGMQVADVTVRDATHYPLALVALPEEEITLRLDHDPDHCTGATAAALLDLVVRVLKQLADDPERPVGRLDLLGEQQRADLDRHNATTRPVGAPTLTALLADAAAAHADRVAVVADDARLTYRELHERAGRVAALLAERGVGADDVVAVALPRSAELVVALLGVLRAGAAYLPLDLDHPAARLAAMVERARAATVLTRAEVLPALGGTRPGTVVLDDPDVRAHLAGLDPAAHADVHPDQLAYTIFTSGSTGEPKGVAVAHRAIANRLRWMQHTYRLSPDDRVAHKTPVGFDVSVWELLWPLATGATMVVARPGGHRDPAHLAALLAEQRVTVCHFVPSMLRAFLDEPAAAGAAHLRQVIVSGEALSDDLARDFAAVLDARLDNLYGPTEAAVDVTAHPVLGPGTEPLDGPVPIGRPVWNTALHVLDTALRPLPAGAVGELYLGGVQLARGYAGRGDLTASRFVADPFGAPGSRLYRTGDLVRRRADGAVEYLGRTDDQVKINGVRLEPAEVEAALRALPAVADAAVAVRRAPSAGRRLVGYLVYDDPGAAPAEEELRRALAERLPAAMVPAVFVALDALPLTVNGKLDRAALPEAADGEPPTRPPRTPAEHTLCAAFAEVLGLERVGADADFFALGGDSVSSLRLVGRLVRGGLDLTVRDVFVHRTPERLARLGRPAQPPPTGPAEETGEEFADLMAPGEFAELAQMWREQD